MRKNLNSTSANPPQTALADTPMTGYGTLHGFCIEIESGATCSQQDREAIAGFRRACQHDPSLRTMRATGRLIIPRFKRLARIAGLSKKSVSNMEANARSLLRRYHAANPGIHHRTGLTGQWLETFTLLSENKYLKVNLSRFCHWCQDQGINPLAVDNQALKLFENYLRQVIGAPQPTTSARLAAKHWTAAAETITGWPSFRMTLPSAKVTPKSPPLAKLSDEMRLEIQAYLEFLSKKPEKNHDDQFEDTEEIGGPDYSPATIKGRLSVLRRAIGLLSAGRGIPVNKVRLADLGDLENIRLTLKAYKKDLGDNPAAPSLASMSYALLVLARDYLQVNQAAIDKIVRLSQKAAAPARDARNRNGGLTPKNRHRLLQIGPRELSKLLLLPKQLIERAHSRVKAGTAGVNDFVDAQVGCAIAILLAAPTRAKNTVMTRLGHHLDLLANSDGSAILKYDYDETKNKRSLRFIIPCDVADLVRVYAFEIMPSFSRSENTDFLYPGLSNATKAAAHLGTQITNRVSKHVGIVMNQHLFRHLLAIIYLRKNPGNYAVVQELLGHSSTETTRQYYCGLEGEAALAHFQNVMASLRLGATLIEKKEKGRCIRKSPANKRRAAGGR